MLPRRRPFSLGVTFWRYRYRYFTNNNKNENQDIAVITSHYWLRFLQSYDRVRVREIVFTDCGEGTWASWVCKMFSHGSHFFHQECLLS